MFSVFKSTAFVVSKLIGLLDALTMIRLAGCWIDCWPNGGAGGSTVNAVTFGTVATFGTACMFGIAATFVAFATFVVLVKRTVAGFVTGLITGFITGTTAELLVTGVIVTVGSLGTLGTFETFETVSALDTIGWTS